MAQSEHLPIYKRGYELCLYLEQVVRGFSRSNAYTSAISVAPNGIGAVDLDYGTAVLYLREEERVSGTVSQSVYELGEPTGTTF